MTPSEVLSDESLLDERQRTFCREYVRTGNAQASALKAGYSESTAKNATLELVPRLAPVIAKLATEVARQAQERLAIDAKDVVDELAALGFHDPRNYIVVEPPTTEGGKPTFRPKPINELTRVEAAAIKDLEFRKDGTVAYRLYDKNAALGNLARCFGMMNPKIQVDMRQQHLHQHFDFSKMPTDVIEKQLKELAQYMEPEG